MEGSGGAYAKSMEALLLNHRSLSSGCSLPVASARDPGRVVPGHHRERIRPGTGPRCILRISGRPLRRAPCRVPSVETPANCDSMGSGSTERHRPAAPVCSTQFSDRPTSRGRGLPAAGCVDAESPTGVSHTGHCLVPSRFFVSASANYAARNGQRRHHRRAQLSARPLRVSRACGARLRGRIGRELRSSRSACRSRLGARPHCSLRGESGRRDPRGPVGRRAPREPACGVAGKRGSVPSRDHAERVCVFSHANGGRGPLSGRRVCGGGRLHECRCLGAPHLSALEEPRSSPAGSTSSALRADQRDRSRAVDPARRRNRESRPTTGRGSIGASLRV